MNDPSSELYQMTRQGSLEELLGTGAAFLQERLTEFARRRRWREARRSPPKCIHCASSDITVLPIGTGDRIPRDMRPKHWDHPVLDHPQRGKGMWAWLRARTKRHQR